MRIHQVNLQPHFGGGEVYTAFLCRALAEHGVQTRLYCHAEADYWARLDLPATTELARVRSVQDIPALLENERCWLLGHGPLPSSLLAMKGHLKTAVAHMPMFGRNPAPFRGHDMIFGVSAYVRDGLLGEALPAWPEPLYGVAGLQRRLPAGDGLIYRHSRYDWDRRKMRDRLLGWCEPLIERLRPHPQYIKDPAARLTLGIVSRITPIKQFPRLFAALVPVLARHPEVRLEIFGSGGYASVRDLRRALAPIADRVRFWGQQQDVAAVYAGIDYLLAGLPEKEALGLNVIEAQACGTPVLAVASPPFTETVADGRSGFLFADPRQDGGQSFEQLLVRLAGSPRPDPRRDAREHLENFSYAAFVARVGRVSEWAGRQLAPG